ncbi:hypothetical protein [Streptomyces sp. B21-083]|uniref:hypothetical protein n=1 Tax=Streptomyces sp. B21-083 TaxID=3039410 RepID=UPI002FF36F65
MYKVAGKVFLIVTDDPDEQIITVITGRLITDAVEDSYDPGRPATAAGREGPPMVSGSTCHAGDAGVTFRW